MYGPVSAAGTPLRSLRSAPAQNALSPAPVSTTARTSSSSAKPARDLLQLQVHRARQRVAHVGTVERHPRDAVSVAARRSTSAMLATLSSRLPLLLGAAARARLLAEVRLQVLRGQLVADERRRRARRLGELVEIDAGLDAHRVQHRDDILGREVARRARRVRTAAEPARRRVDRRDAHLQRDEAVRERGALRVVEVHRDRVGADASRARAPSTSSTCARVRDADRVAERDLIDAEVAQLADERRRRAADRPRPRTGSRSTSTRTRAPARPRRARAARPPRTPSSVSAIVLLTFFLLCVSDADMNTAISFMPDASAVSRPRAVRHERAHPHAGGRVHAARDLGGIRELRNPLRRHEARDLDRANARGDERVDEADLVRASARCAPRSAGRRADRPRRS